MSEFEEFGKDMERLSRIRTPLLILIAISLGNRYMFNGALLSTNWGTFIGWMSLIGGIHLMFKSLYIFFKYGFKN